MILAKLMFSEVSDIEWDENIELIDEATHLSASFMLNYFDKFDNVIDNHSFLVINEHKAPMAVCSIGLSEISKTREISFNGTPCAVISITRNVTPSERRKIINFSYVEIFKYAINNNVEIIRMLRHPLNIISSKQNKISAEYMFENIKYNFMYSVDNTLIVDLRTEEDVLLQNVNKYTRQKFRKSLKKGLFVKIYNMEYNSNQLNLKLEEFRMAHLKASGRETRPKSTWISMLEAMEKGNASMFIAYSDENNPVSYLFCGEYKNAAFGWSQVNVEQYEKEFSPRHILEWEAILYYKRNGFSFYEIGERFYETQMFHRSTDKEQSISEFKEKYGTIIYPKIHWTSFIDKETLNVYLDNNVNEFKNSNNLFKMEIE